MSGLFRRVKGACSVVQSHLRKGACALKQGAPLTGVIGCQFSISLLCYIWTSFRWHEKATKTTFGYHFS